MSTLAMLQSILVEEYKRSPDQLRSDATLEDLGIDSLDFVDLMFRVEDRFGLKIQDDIPRSVTTLGDVATYIDQVLASQAAERVARSDADQSS